MVEMVPTCTQGLPKRSLMSLFHANAASELIGHVLTVRMKQTVIVPVPATAAMVTTAKPKPVTDLRDVRLLLLQRRLKATTTTAFTVWM